MSASDDKTLKIWELATVGGGAGLEGEGGVKEGWNWRAWRGGAGGGWGEGGVELERVEGRGWRRRVG